MADKRILIIAGPNGAGKTTFAREFLPEDEFENFVNADLIAAGLSPLNPDAAAMRAGRLMLEEIDGYVKRGECFAFETTLSGRIYAKRVWQWQHESYYVELVFLKLQNVETAIDRIAKRVSQGGHDIPEEVIRRRFHAGLDNLENLYKPIIDDWTVFDNSGDETQVMESSKDQ